MIQSSYDIPFITPPAEHPRLMLRAADLERIKENMTLPENAGAVSVYYELCARPITGTGATPEYGSYDLAEALSAEALAFRALLSGEKADADAALNSILLLLRSFTVTGGNMGARWGGHLIFVAAEVYDWCYTFIADEQREYIISRCEQIAGLYFEMGYPPAKQSPISGHGTEAQLLRDLLAFSIAVYDERPDIYNFCAGRICGEYITPVRKLLGGGAHNQGPSYGGYRWLSLAWAELLFKAMSGEGVFLCLEKTADWLVYMTRPDGQDVRLGDDFNENKGECNRRAPFTVPFFFAYALTGRSDFAALFRAGLCRDFMLPVHHGMDYYTEGSWGEGLFSAVSLLIFDRFTPPYTPAPLPVCRYFGSPVGETVFKKGDTHILFKIGEYWGANHDHLDTGCFQVFSGAALLTDSGVYDSYHSHHRLNYLTETAAHNCLTVQMPGAEGSALSDCGTKRPAGGDEADSIEQLLTDEYLMARVISHRESETGCELMGDLTPAYARSCKKVIRKMEYDDITRAVTVTDDVTALSTECKKAVHLHCQAEPEINGSTVIFRNAGHKCVCRVVSPENAVITKTGGKGREFLSGGINYPPKPPYTAEEGWGEVTITPRNQAEHDVFKLEFLI